MDDRGRVLAYRASGHQLDRRPREGAGPVEAVGAIGVRDVHGSAAVALHARVAGFSGEHLRAAVDDGAVVEVLSARGVSTPVPAGDVDVFTVGTLPGSARPPLPDLEAEAHALATMKACDLTAIDLT